MPTDRELFLRSRIKRLTWLFMAGLFLSGVTALPLVTEVGVLAKLFGVHSMAWAGWPNGARWWIWKVWVSLQDAQHHYPFLFYGTDWLAFGHFIIALAFVGALRDPVRNCWLFDFGLLACWLVIPYALVFGAVRGIPFWWRCIDCSFGLAGLFPLWFCREWTQELEGLLKTRQD